MSMAIGILLLWLGAACVWWAIHSGGEQGATPLWTAYRSVLGRAVPDS